MPFAGEGVRRTKKSFGIYLDKDYLGRVIDIFGNYIDGYFKEEINENNFIYSSIESDILGIIERKAISESLVTGIISIDCIIPIGKGQRQLFVGSRGIGKTTTLIDIMINQKENNVICIYVGIAQKQSDIALIKSKLEENNALDNCIILCSDAGKTAINHYLSPYVGITIAEYFSRIKKQDVLIIYDDLSNHAIAYRELNLLIKNSPTREAYPADVFYSHSKLLERAGSFINYGSITAFPVVQLQEDDITAYIPTNLISITDGQVFFDTKLFNSGIFPAINTELSVSRICGSAQSKLIRNLSKSLRLDLAQYHENSAFSQFGGDLEEETKNKLKKGDVLIELLTQPLSKIYSIADQAIILFLFKFYSDKVQEIKNLKEFIFWIIDYFKKVYKNVYLILKSGKEVDLINENEIKKIIEEAFLINNY